MNDVLLEYPDESPRVTRFRESHMWYESPLREKSEYIFCEALSDLKSFSDALKEARAVLGIKIKPMPMFNNTLEASVEFIKRQGYTFHPDFWQVARNIREKFNLPEVWQISIAMVLITNTLPVPPYDTGIEIRDPKTSVRDGAGILEQASHLAHGLSFPSIYFTRQVSEYDLHKWITKHYQTLKDTMKSLPAEARLFKLNEKKIALGRLAWIFKEDNLSYADMTRRFYKYTASNESEEEEINRMYGYPDADAFKKAYTSYLDVVRKVKSDLGE